MKLILLLLMLIPTSAFADLNNCRITTQFMIGATNTTTLVLAAKGNRRCLMVQNTSLGSTTIYLKFGASTISFANMTGLQLTAGTMWAPIVVPMNELYISSNSALGASTMIIQGE